MPAQRDLFGDDYDQYAGTPPHVKGSDTSREAAESMALDAKHLRAVVYRHILGSGSVGMTCDRVEEIMDGRHQTISARIRELVNEGRIVDTGKRKPTRSGRQARIYVATCNADPTIINPQPTVTKQKPWDKVTLGEVAAAFAEDGLTIERQPNGCGFVIIEGQTWSALYPNFHAVCQKLARMAQEKST